MVKTAETARLGKQRRNMHASLNPNNKRRAVSAGFTLIELLVSLAIIALLIGILLPSLAHMKESTRRVVCTSNIHQMGIAISMYADGRGKGELPESFSAHHTSADGQANYAQFDLAESLKTHREGSGPEYWDGLGILYYWGFLDDPEVYYCPSHKGEHPYSRYQHEWYNADETIYCNYQYRGIPWEYKSRKLDTLGPDVTLITDGLRRLSDYNHEDGNNLLKADLSVRWYDDSEGNVTDMIGSLGQGSLLNDNDTLMGLWLLFDKNGGEKSSNTGEFNDYFGYEYNP